MGLYGSDALANKILGPQLIGYFLVGYCKEKIYRQFPEDMEK